VRRSGFGERIFGIAAQIGYMDPKCFIHTVLTDLNKSLTQGVPWEPEAGLLMT
jgi:hypothetical protein